MIRVMTEPELAKSMLQNAQRYVEMEFDNQKNTDNLARMFYAVYEHYNKQTEIPQDLLFDPDEFPVY